MATPHYYKLINGQHDYLIGTVEVSNAKSRAVLERSGFEFVENRTLLVHVEGKKYVFMYFRKYRGD